MPSVERLGVWLGLGAGDHNLGIGDDLLAARAQDDAVELGLLLEELLDTLANLLRIRGRLVQRVRQLDVLTHATVIGEQRDEAVIINTHALELNLLDEGDVGSVRRRHEILHLLSGEDVLRDEVALGVAVLSGLRRRDVKDLAGVTLDHDVAALADLPRLHRVGLRSTGIGRLEGLIVLVTHGSAKIYSAQSSALALADLPR